MQPLQPPAVLGLEDAAEVRLHLLPESGAATPHEGFANKKEGEGELCESSGVVGRGGGGSQEADHPAGGVLPHHGAAGLEGLKDGGVHTPQVFRIASPADAAGPARPGSPSLLLPRGPAVPSAHALKAHKDVEHHVHGSHQAFQEDARLQRRAQL